MKKAVYAGTFDPFTNQHKEILLSAIELFDHVTLVISYNPTERRRLNIDETKQAILKEFASISNLSVEIVHGFVADYCNKHNIKYLLRTFRTPCDYAYEESMVNINLHLNPNLKIVTLRTKKTFLPPSAVWQLFLQGKDVSSLVPPAILERMNAPKFASF